MIGSQRLASWRGGNYSHSCHLGHDEPRGALAFRRGGDALSVDWFQRRDQFRAFLSSLAGVSVPVFNSPEVLVGFADKLYLLDLAKRGVPVVPTFALSQRELDRIPEMMEEHGWHEAVLKPAFSARAYDAYRFPRHRAMEVVGEAVSLEASERWLVQPFLPDIVHGELSFHLHRWRVQPRGEEGASLGEWRVQEFHGGLVEPIDVSDDSVMQAAAMLEQATPSTLYARVDCVVVDGRLTLMELELVEPELFFRFEPEAADPVRGCAGAAARGAGAVGPFRRVRESRGGKAPEVSITQPHQHRVPLSVSRTSPYFAAA